MDWRPYLDKDECVQWEGRPAPRCFTFRNWKHSIFGLLFLLISAYWQSVGMQMAAVYDWPWMAWLPTPFLLFGLYMSIGHILLARLEWEKVFYVVTDRKLLARRGLFKQKIHELDLDKVTFFRMQPLGKALGNLRAYGATKEESITFNCIEHPEKVTDLLELAMGEKACRLEQASPDCETPDEKGT